MVDSIADHASEDEDNMAEKPHMAEPLPWNKKWEDRSLQSSSGSR